MDTYIVIIFLKNSTIMDGIDNDIARFHENYLRQQIALIYDHILPKRDAIKRKSETQHDTQQSKTKKLELDELQTKYDALLDYVETTNCIHTYQDNLVTMLRIDNQRLKGQNDELNLNYNLLVQKALDDAEIARQQNAIKYLTDENETLKEEVAMLKSSMY
jgi:hypothetical protein